MFNFKDNKIPTALIKKVDVTTLETIKEMTNTNRFLNKKLKDLFYAKVQSDCLELIKSYNLKDNKEAYKCYKVIRDQIVILVELIKTTLDNKYCLFNFNEIANTYSELDNDELAKHAKTVIANYNKTLKITNEFIEFVDNFFKCEQNFNDFDETMNYEIIVLRHNNKVLQLLLDKNDRLTLDDYSFIKEIYQIASNKSNAIKELKDYPDYMDKLVSDIAFGNNRGQRSNNPMFKSTIVGNSIF